MKLLVWRWTFQKCGEEEIIEAGSERLVRAVVKQNDPKRKRRVKSLVACEALDETANIIDKN